MKAVPLFHAFRDAATDTAALEVLHSGQIAAGPRVAAFESALAQRLGHAELVSTVDMSMAMLLALRLAGVGPGDEVLSPAYTCLSSTAPIANLGARPRWVDVEPLTGLLDPAALRRAISARTKACVVYHAAGYPARTAEIASICREAGLPLIEDCNTALGARQDGQSVGQQGDFAVYSFYPNRQINAADGGALGLRDAAQAQRARRLRRFGVALSGFRDALGEIDSASDVAEIGWSGAMSQLHAALGLAQMESLDARLTATRRNAADLASRLQSLSDQGLKLVQATAGSEPSPWGLLVLVEQRDAVLAALKRAGVMASKLHHRVDSYSGFGADPAELPGTAAFLARVIALPCGHWLQPADLGRVTGAVDVSIRLARSAA